MQVVAYERKHSCSKCTSEAVWMYEPSDSEKDQRDRFYCDDCVKRGCSCNYNVDTLEEDKDFLGRLYPCCEYMYDDRGFHVE